ncbi:toxic anion resistance protein [Peribacillus psychrosaccharolyticus]|uniref:Toxic anion resistance protein n=1 Tax=Peribacillus psychrosaccharolyticus TaxID=1407 RepID=A0A974NRE1_PERPY|nr:toxic anion resistance protein [Peribacillus psychrosaccharolyticus]MEC2057009.1 toxic anion resistance protein [Peribacillus psychrosaccharolyticus]MED3744931.1 toxic anion resistance protein [Peribacillus psychrosaccharolyticus]QQT02446.1 toxic anion resistance protein [Peribacillus psychrosaccharolyticus]
MANLKSTEIFDENTNQVSLAKTEELKVQLQNDPEVARLAQQIDVKNQMSLLEFGKEPAMEISKFSDRILSTMKSSSMEDSSELLKQLGKIMDRFDSKDFAPEKRGLLSKLFNKGEKMIDKIFGKYQSMGGEIDKVYVEISKYQNEMVSSTHTLEELYEQNFNYYLALEKYAVAGNAKVEELKATLLPEYETRAASGDQIAGMELDTLRNGIEALEQRVYDLEMAKMVALQTAPQIRLLQRGNTKLIGKINSAFVTTIPIFKNGLIQAVSAKRQKLVADSMSELDKRTNEMLIRNAQNITSQSVDIARLAGAPSIKIETIEESWSIIIKGLEETKRIEEENKRTREEGTKRLIELKETYQTRQLKG